MKAKPVLLEPIVTVEVTCPADNVGDITGDLASRRGRPQGQDMLPGGMAVIRAVVPLAELADYNSRLSSITGGQGSYAMEFSHYEAVPETSSSRSSMPTRRRSPRPTSKGRPRARYGLRCMKATRRGRGPSSGRGPVVQPSVPELSVVAATEW